MKACNPLFYDYFSLSKRELNKVVKIRPRVVLCVRDAIVHARAKTRTSRQQLWWHAEGKGLIQRTPIRINRATNLSHYMLLKNIVQPVQNQQGSRTSSANPSTGNGQKEHPREKLKVCRFESVLDEAAVVCRSTRTPTTS